MDYEKLAKKIGNIRTGEAVSAADVRDELRSKSYIVQGGKLSPSELFRLGVYAKKRTIRRIVAEAFAADAVRARPVAQPKRDTALAMRRSELIDQAMATASRRPLALAKGFDPLYDKTTQAKFKVLAWAGYRAGLVR